MPKFILRRIVLALSFAFSVSLTVPSHARQTLTLYDQLGGDALVEKIVYTALEYAHSDPRIAEKFENSNIERNSKFITEYICALTDGPCEYTGQDMHKVHYGLGLTSAHFNAMAECFQKSMEDYNIPFSTQNKLLARLAPTHHDVIVRSRTGR